MSPRDPIEWGRAARRVAAAALEGTPVTKKKALRSPAAVQLLAEAGRDEVNAMRRTAERNSVSERVRGADAVAYEHGVTGSDDLGPTDEALVKFLTATPQQQLNEPGSSLTGYSIREELAEMELRGTMRPFVEGEPIGCVCTDPPRVAAPELRTRGQIMEARRKEMLEARRDNDTKLDALMRRYSR